MFRCAVHDSRVGARGFVVPAGVSRCLSCLMCRCVEAPHDIDCVGAEGLKRSMFCVSSARKSIAELIVDATCCPDVASEEEHVPCILSTQDFCGTYRRRNVLSRVASEEEHVPCILSTEDYFGTYRRRNVLSRVASR